MEKSMGEKVIKSSEFKSLILKEKKVACDSMLFSYHFHNLITYAKLTTIFFQLLESEKITLATSIISYLEILSYKELKNDPQKQLLIRQFFRTMKNLKIYTLDIEIAEEAGEIRRALHLKLPDAIQLATAVISQTGIFLTNDKDFKNILWKNIRIIYLDEFIK
jgi:predicted nucleic acid-binding protein